MSSTTFANPRDVVNLGFSLQDYPYEQDDSPAPPRQTLQGRVITIDAIGIVLASNGGNIMPSFNEDSEELTLPTRGDLFPWAAIKRVGFVVTGAEYEYEWRVHRAKETVFMDANDMRLPESNSEYQNWARGQDEGDLRRRLQDAFAAEPPANENNDVG